MAASDKSAEPLETANDVVETPAPTSSELALSRFEFEAGKGNEGTKILMVEWDTTAATRQGGQDEVGEWEVSWEGKKTSVLPVRDPETGDHGNLHRVYFLLPPGMPIPPLVRVMRRDGGGGRRGKGKVTTTLQTKPMPAIFPAELAGGRDAGGLGVLHMVWAKRRLHELQHEIAAEMRANGEGVGLEMALRDRQYIVDRFGLTGADHAAEGTPRPTRLHVPDPDAPASPRSPVGGRLGDKLRGLKLATGPSDLAQVAVCKTAQSSGQAVPGGPESSLAASAETRSSGEDNTEEELFALPLSPRGPGMKKSPFSLM